MTSPASAPRPLGLIGLGLMGTAFAARLREGGFAVVGCDVVADRRRDLVQLGGSIAADAADVFRRCDRVVLSLPSHAEVAEVIAGAGGALRTGHVVIDTSTGDPERGQALAGELAARGPRS